MCWYRLITLECEAFQPGDSRAFWEISRFAKKELSPSQTFQSLSTSLHRLEAIMTKDMDVETPAQIAAGAFARDLMVSNLGQMPYESEFGRLKLIARCFSAMRLPVPGLLPSPMGGIKLGTKC